jgi:ACS family D-galactonate transporter-like MFS transporter
MMSRACGYPYHVSISTTSGPGERSTTPANRDGIDTVQLVVLCQVAHFLTFAALPLLLPAIREDLGIDFTQAGMLAAAGALSYAFMQVPAGYLSDRFGPRRLFIIGLIGWSALSLVFGFLHAFWLALVNQFVAGAFRALLFAPGLALLASWSPPHRRATAMSLFLFGGHVGALLLSVAGPLLAERYGWRPTFAGLAAMGLGSALLFRTFAKDSPGAGTRIPPRWSDLVYLTRYPILWVCSWLQFVRFAVVMGFGFWLPSFLVSDRRFSLQEAGLVMAASAALSAPSNTLGAYVSDRLGNPPLIIGGALTILAGTAALLPMAESTPMLLFAIAIYSVFCGFYFGPLFLVPVEALGSRVAGSAIGFSNLFANFGGFLSVYALGATRDLTGSFTWGFRSLGGLCLAGVVLAAVLAKLRTGMLAGRQTGAAEKSEDMHA